MVIAVNTRLLLTDYLEGIGHFIYETFQCIVKDHPEHRFIFIFDRPFDQRFVYSANVEAIVAGPPARHPLLWKYWYDVKIPAILKKYKADVFVSCDGYCSLRTKVPQCLVVHDLAFLHYPSGSKVSHLGYLKRNMPKFLAKAGSIATVSDFSKKDISDQYAVEPGKIDIVYNGVKDVFYSRETDERTNIKEKYTEGKEFFLYTGAIHPRKNLMNLLKAFSLFKKRQQSSMKLVLAGRLAWKFESFIEDLKSYKYRGDVILTGYLSDDELAKLTASAYAMVYPSLWEGFGVPVLEAMKSDTPVITSENSSMQEIAKDAALYMNPEDPASIAEKMMLIYKDERLRNQLIAKGKPVAAEYTWERTAGLLWLSIQKAIG